MSYAPIGYYITCDDANCVDCFERAGGLTWWRECGGFESWDEPIAIFPDMEADTPTHCAECGELIAHALTGEGYAYVAEALAETLILPGTPDKQAALAQRERVMDAWRAEYASECDRPADYISEAFDAYLTCALWSSTVDVAPTAPDGVEGPVARETERQRPMDDFYNTSDINGYADDSDDYAEMRDELTAFVEGDWADLVGMAPAQAGHDFWLTRNHHGAGFWDRGLGARGDRLTQSSHAYGESNLMLGDDGKLYIN